MSFGNIPVLIPRSDNTAWNIHISKTNTSVDSAFVWIIYRERVRDRERDLSPPPFLLLLHLLHLQTAWLVSSISVLVVSPWAGGQGTCLQADCTFEEINWLTVVEATPHCLFHSVFPLPLNMFVEDLSSALAFIPLQGLSHLRRLAAASLSLMGRVRKWTCGSV